jgi:hypothetical protein
MANQHRAIIGFSVAGLAVGLFITAPCGSAHAFPLLRGAQPIYTAVFERMTPRPGWAEVCRNSKCNMQMSTPREISLTPKVCSKTIGTDQAHIIGELGQAH